MFSCTNRVGGLAHQQTRQFSSTFPMKHPEFKAMPSSSFLQGYNLENISSQKKFVNPNFVNPKNANVHSRSPNGQLNCTAPISDVCTQFYNDRNKINPQVKSFSTEEITKENTQRKKEFLPINPKKMRDHQKSHRKPHKNKMNFDIKCEIDEIGVDCLEDQFESDSNEDIEVTPVFIHEAIPDIEIQSDMCKISSSPICITIGSPEQVSAVVLSFTERRRMPSECSEDSFIVFQCDDSDSSEDESDEESDYDEDSESVCSDEDEDVDIEIEEQKCKKTGSKKTVCTIFNLIWV